MISCRYGDDARGGASRDTLSARVRSPLPLPHEWLAATYVVIGIFVLEGLPVTYQRKALLLAYTRYVAGVLIVAAVTLGVVRLVARIRRRSIRSPLPLLAETMLIGRAALALLLTLPVHFLLKSFTYLLNPTVWDRQLYRWDQIIHLGISPGRFLTTLLDNEILLHGFDVLYSAIYFPILVVYSALLMTLSSPRNRLAFVAAFITVWILGSVCYVALPSWGPVFVYPDDFEAALQSMPLTVGVQQVLYGEISSLVENPLGPRVIYYGCVAAFPSLHIAIIALFTLASRGVARWWFRMNLVLLFAMILGSVITGYHYLLDGWAGLALAFLAWWIGRRSYPDPHARGGAAADARRAPAIE